ncbi:Rhodanese-like domain-containing protein [Astrocystis sublimbata]|nr:Rhodanese-like domain-containing protein [Astrocystis sublimbata]
MSSIPTRRILASRTCLRISGLRNAPSCMLRATFTSAATRVGAQKQQPPSQSQIRRQQWPTQQGAANLRASGARWSSISATGHKIWTFEEIQALASQNAEKASKPEEQQDENAENASKPQENNDNNDIKSTNPIIVDVREPQELLESGKIPGAINVPLRTTADAWHISNTHFMKRYGFARPDKDAELVFYCKAGVRSRAAAGLAQAAGWTSVGEFPGSWLEWEEKGGQVEKVEEVRKDGSEGGVTN